MVELERELASAKEAHKAAQQAVAQARREEAEAKQVQPHQNAFLHAALTSLWKRVRMA